MKFLLVSFLVLFIFWEQNAQAQTGAEAFGLGCGGGCHSTDRKVIKAIPKGHEKIRQQWLFNFMAQHPCNRDDLKPLILDYLLERTRR